MTRKFLPELAPSVLMGAGIILATLIARSAGSSSMLLAAPLLLACALVLADALSSRLRGEASAPSLAAWILGGALMLASLILTLRDPRLVGTLIPIIGSSHWIVLLLRHQKQRSACRA